ncbi:BTAD domain-containing putative transcriptional regulator [Kitasatospora viridis]|uniref:BTAD domain-containing putative transcriptional regulator n=1 Tax=Kitasatospora viridis TaxID=281105 RepID=UPI0014785CB9|nr:BTAD domain-containing putative transcriptional regulator [Kitasatospora viridis]
MRIELLGPLEVRDGDGRAVAVGGATVRAVLARLALAGGRVVSGRALAADLWGDEGGGGNALQRRVSRLRAALEPGVLRSEGGGYRLAVDAEQVDALRFRRLAAEGRAALAAGAHEPAASLLREAEQLWRGPALAGLGDPPFAAEEAGRLASERLLAAEDRFDAELALGRAAALVGELERLAAAEPWRERLQGQLMRALQATGRPSEALAVYRRVRADLAEQLGMEPGVELTAIHLDVLRQVPAPAPAPQRRVPALVTSFVGREEELRQVAELLERGRLVTVAGPGGAGKTRFVRELLAARPGEAWFVDLAAVGEPAYLTQAVLVTVGPAPLTGTAGDPADRVVEALRHRSALLVLDNCEHLAEAVVRLVVRLLADCPELRILATSREVLGLPGEQQFPLPALRLPARGSAAEEALRAPAVRLFADRAAAVRPGFAVRAANAAAVVEICRRLDGLPLAIELAAARVRILDPAEIAARLDDRFHLLANADRTAPARHQTLRAVVDWSWSMLDGPERALARRLTVFAGGATLEAVERVCADGELPRTAVLEVLAALVDKSLVEVTEPAVAGTGTRYRMLDTIRAYCAEELAAAGEAERWQRAHGDYWTGFARAAEPLLRTADQLPWLDRLRAEHANLFAALRRALDDERNETALRLCAALMWPWMLQGGRYDYAMVDRVLALPGGELPTERTVIATAHAMVLMVFAGWAAELGQRALVRAREHADRAEPGAHPALAFVEPLDALLARDPVRARRELTAALVGAEPWTEALALLLRGFVEAGLGEPARARADVGRAREVFTLLGDRWGRYLAAQWLAPLTGDPAAAADCYREALDCLAELGMTRHVPVVVAQLGTELLRAGDPAGARAELTRALALAEQTENLAAAVWASSGMMELAQQAGDFAEVRQRFEQLRRALAHGPSATGLLPAMLSRAAAAMLREDGSDGARDLLRQGVEIVRGAPGSQAAPGTPGRRAALRTLAEAALADGDPAHAATLLGLAVTLDGDDRSA